MNSNDGKVDASKAVRIQVHGHRGSRGTHPENSLPAFQEAVDAKADYLEMDLQLSADGVLVINHDPMLTANHCKDAKGKKLKKPVAINSLTVAQITKYDCGSVRQEKFPEQKLIPKTPIPTFEQLLEWHAKSAPKMGLNVEIKMDAKPAPDAKFVATKVLELVKKYNVADRLFLQSFDFTPLEVVKKLEPSIRMSCLFEDNEKDICARTEKVGCKAVSPHFSLVTADVIKECHGKGIQVVPWTVNKEEDWKKLKDLGVDAIITDYPRKLVAYLDACTAAVTALGK